MSEILNIPDNIPQDLLDKAKCVVVIPSVFKAAFIVGGSYGRGTMVCRSGRTFSGGWGSPAMMVLEGGSVGFQIGGEATDFVLLIMNDHGANSLLHSKVKLGGDVSAAAGPVGRTAEANTDAYLRSEILTYSRARGLFAGVSLEGASFRPDNEGNEALYGRRISDAEKSCWDLPQLLRRPRTNCSHCWKKLRLPHEPVINSCQTGEGNHITFPLLPRSHGSDQDLTETVSAPSTKSEFDLKRSYCVRASLNTTLA